VHDARQGREGNQLRRSEALTDQGFSDVKVVPDSFLVSAKDKQGYPVTMLIGPNSLTVFTMIQNRHEAKGGQPKQ
jgi:hypothetical protein